jgi:hypothetical protein
MAEPWRTLYNFMASGTFTNRKRRLIVGTIFVPFPWEMTAISASCQWPFHLQIIAPGDQRFFGAMSLLNDGILVAGPFMLSEKMSLPVPSLFKPGDTFKVRMRLPEGISYGRRRPKVMVVLHGNRLHQEPGTANEKPQN